MNYSNRFYKLAQILFTNEINKQEKDAAQKSIELLDKIELDLQAWLDTIEKNLEVFNNYHGAENALVAIAEKFEKVETEQKQKYERVIVDIKEMIELVNKIQDVEMQNMVVNLTKASEEFTELYNELTDMSLKIGEEGFIQKFKDESQKILDNNEGFFDILKHLKDYMQKNIMGEHALS
jgi:hypothetical protein